MPQKPLELGPDALYRHTDPQQLGFETTSELEVEQQIIGQERAVRSVDFGVGIRSHGYNVYALGPAEQARPVSPRTFSTGNRRGCPLLPTGSM
ncbi:MAG: hypothetical protein Kow00129_14610 [Thermoleophilia bacterium]